MHMYFEGWTIEMLIYVQLGGGGELNILFYNVNLFLQK